MTHKTCSYKLPSNYDLWPSLHVDDLRWDPGNNRLSCDAQDLSDEMVNWINFHGSEWNHILVLGNTTYIEFYYEQDSDTWRPCVTHAKRATCGYELFLDIVGKSLLKK